MISSIDSNDTLSDKLASMTDGYDDPNRGPVDRAANALDGRDDPNRGPLDRAGWRRYAWISFLRRSNGGVDRRSI